MVTTGPKRRAAWRFLEIHYELYMHSLPFTKRFDELHLASPDAGQYSGFVANELLFNLTENFPAHMSPTAKS